MYTDQKKVPVHRMEHMDEWDGEPCFQGAMGGYAWSCVRRQRKEMASNGEGLVHHYIVYYGIKVNEFGLRTGGFEELDIMDPEDIPDRAEVKETEVEEMRAREQDDPDHEED